MQNFSALALRASTLLILASLGACHDPLSSSSSTAAAEQSLAPIAAADALTLSSVNIAPTLSGTPATTAMIGASYSFTPSATDVNSDTLTFSIQNKPQWATFNASTGQLLGTPDSAGLSAPVTLSVSDGKATTRLAPFTITVAAPASAGSALVSWNVPTLNADGSALTDLAGYHVYYGTDPAQLTRVEVPGSTTLTYTAANLPPGTYYFTVAAYNSSGVESAQPTVLTTLIG